MVERMLNFDTSPFSPLYSSWIQESRTLEIAKDYFRFVTTFFEVIDTSAPHIYHSALPLSPQSSIVRGLYKQYARPLARVVRGLPDAWEPVTATKHYPGLLGSTVAWSPCNRFIAVPKSDTVQILDAKTLGRLNILESPFPYSPLDRVCLSPDGRLLIGFGYRGRLTSWDLQTGGQICTIGSALNYTMFYRRVFSSTYSADGRTIAIACGNLSDTVPPLLAT